MISVGIVVCGIAVLALFILLPEKAVIGENAVDTEAQREDEATDEVVDAKSEEELYDNPYIKHIRSALDGYLDGTNNGVEEGTTEKVELDSGTRCGLDTFDRDYYRSDFSVVKMGQNSYGGTEAYIAFDSKPDTLFWVWIYLRGDGEYTLRGFCEYAALIEP